MTVNCYFCDGPVNPHDLGTHAQIIGWVHGPKRNGLRLAEPTDRYAHEACVNKAMQGQASDQPELPLEGIESVAPIKEGVEYDIHAEKFFDTGVWPS